MHKATEAKISRQHDFRTTMNTSLFKLNCLL